MTTTPVHIERQVIHDSDDMASWAAIIEEPPEAWFQSETGLPGFLNFRIIDCMGGNPAEGVLYQDADCQPVDDIDVAFTVASGSVQWDGCADWDTNAECMVHNCDDHDTEGFALILVRAMRTARDLITPEWVR